MHSVQVRIIVPKMLLCCAVGHLGVDTGGCIEDGDVADVRANVVHGAFNWAQLPLNPRHLKTRGFWQSNKGLRYSFCVKLSAPTQILFTAVSHKIQMKA